MKTTNNTPRAFTRGVLLQLLLTETVTALKVAGITRLKWKACDSTITVCARPVSFMHLAVLARTLVLTLLVTVAAHQRALASRVRLKRKLSNSTITATTRPVAGEHLSFVAHAFVNIVFGKLCVLYVDSIADGTEPHNLTRKPT